MLKMLAKKCWVRSVKHGIDKAEVGGLVAMA
jgi:hypothetical protein